MLQYEVTRKQLLDKQQVKIEAMEARAAELQRQKVEHERQWAVSVRERELAKVRRGRGERLQRAERSAACTGVAWWEVRVFLLPRIHVVTVPSPTGFTAAPLPLQLAEEQERDREALRIAGERHRREREMHRKEAEDARRRKKEAFQR
jgi:hypothetical protein